METYISLWVTLNALQVAFYDSKQLHLHFWLIFFFLTKTTVFKHNKKIVKFQNKATYLFCMSYYSLLHNVTC